MEVIGHKMAAKTVTATFLPLYFEVVAGYYCDNDKCTDDEYCCGYNLCCKSYKVWDLWYFWCGLLFFIFLLSMCACLWRLRSRSPLLIGGYTYAPLSQEPAYVQTCAATAPVTMGHGPQSFSDPRGKPPPYSRPDDLQSKRASPPPVYAQVIAHRDVYGN